MKDSVTSGDWGEKSAAKVLTPDGWVCDLTVPAKATTPSVVTMLLCQGHIIIATTTETGAPPPIDRRPGVSRLPHRSQTLRAWV